MMRDNINDPILEEQEPKSFVVSVEETLKEINPGTQDEPRKVRILVVLSTQEEEQILKILREYIDVFA